MKLTIIRGLPGTGKTTICSLINKENIKVYTIDDFKLEYLEKDQGPNAILDSRKYAHKKTKELIKEHHESGKDLILLIEGLIHEEDFVSWILTYTGENNIPSKWIRLTRPIEELLKVEKQRDRIIKNTRKDLEDLHFLMEKNTHPNEILIENDNIEETLKIILDQLLY